MAMTRGRTITPSLWKREELLSLAPVTRLMLDGLHLYADDHGRERVNELLMRAEIFPLDRDITDQQVTEMLIALDDAGCVALYDVAGVSYFAVTDWPKVDRPGDSRYPPPPSRSTRESFVAGERGESEREGERERASERDAPPTDPNLPPSPFCRAHQATGGSEEPCRGCGRARLQRKVWDDERMARRDGGTGDDQH